MPLLMAMGMIFSFSQCSKTGPQGPSGSDGLAGAQGDKGDKGDKGSTGARGTTGATGATGAKGDPGNANVFYTDWTKRTGWSAMAAGTTENTNGSIYSNIIVANDWSLGEITNESAVLVYMRFSNHSPVVAHPIPDNFYESGGGKSGTVLVRYHYTQSWLRIYFLLVEGTWDYNGYMKTTYMPGIEWRVIVIRAATKMSRTSAPLPDTKDYRAVCAYYGIPE